MVELMSGSLVTGTHYATVQSHNSRTKRVTRLSLAPGQQVGDMALRSGTNLTGDAGLRPARSQKVGKHFAEFGVLEFHTPYNTAYAVDRKCGVRVGYSPGGVVTPSDEQMSVGERLRAARKERKLSQERLAKISGVSQTTISDIERGRNVSSKELPTLSAVLGVSTLWLATGRGPRHDSAPIRPTPPQRQINTELMVQAMRAVTAYQQQIGSKLDDDELLRLACRVYEQHIDQPDKTASEMLGYLVSLTKIIGRANGEH